MKAVKYANHHWLQDESKPVQPLLQQVWCLCSCLPCCPVIILTPQPPTVDACPTTPFMHIKSKLSWENMEWPGMVCPKNLMAHYVELEVTLQHVFILSLWLVRVPALLMTPCLIPDKAHPRELNENRAITPTSHIMKTLALVLLWFAHQEFVGVDYIIYRMKMPFKCVLCG